MSPSPCLPDPPFLACPVLSLPAGKRISMRKVIAYIASHFRKDKIWLRRSRPDKRRYQVGVPACVGTPCE